MNDQPTNGELAILIGGVGDKICDIKEHFGRELGEIKEHAARTNGRVTKLEEVKNILIGGLVITNIIFVPVIVQIIIKFFNSK